MLLCFLQNQRSNLASHKILIHISIQQSDPPGVETPGESTTWKHYCFMQSILLRYNIITINTSSWNGSFVHISMNSSDGSNAVTTFNFKENNKVLRHAFSLYN